MRRHKGHSDRGIEHAPDRAIAALGAHVVGDGQPDGLHGIHGARAAHAVQIVQGQDFSIQSNVTSDVVMQQSLFAPGPSPCHYHPGPSFVYVLQGQIQLERSIEKYVCRKTKVFNPGEAYFEVGNQVHRAIVVSADTAVVLVTRFNIPVGGAFTIPANDPGCV